MRLKILDMAEKHAVTFLAQELLAWLSGCSTFFQNGLVAELINGVVQAAVWLLKRGLPVALD